jgi:hypothetical protein
MIMTEPSAGCRGEGRFIPMNWPDEFVQRSNRARCAISSTRCRLKTEGK